MSGFVVLCFFFFFQGAGDGVFMYLLLRHICITLLLLHFLKSSFYSHWVNAEKWINRCDRTRYPSSGSKLTWMAKESILTLGCDFSFICACNTIRTLKEGFCISSLGVLGALLMRYYTGNIFCWAGLILHSSEASWQHTKFYGDTSGLFDKCYLTDYSYVTIWIFKQIVLQASSFVYL